jgi:hypothetical protein
VTEIVKDYLSISFLIADISPKARNDPELIQCILSTVGGRDPSRELQVLSWAV